MTGREIFLAQLEPHMLQTDLENVCTAYIFSKYGHRPQVRDGGGRYFEHPKAVANIIIQELGLRSDWRLPATALLHDIPEDSWILSEHRMRVNFGREVALWVKYLTKNPEEGYYERLTDVHTPWQVILVKLCDRLDNLRTLSGCRPEKQRRKISETQKYFPALADALISRCPRKYKRHAKYLKEKIEEICNNYERDEVLS